jgi:hypothetical protein
MKARSTITTVNFLMILGFFNFLSQISMVVLLLVIVFLLDCSCYSTTSMMNDWDQYLCFFFIDLSKRNKL